MGSEPVIIFAILVPIFVILDLRHDRRPDLRLFILPDDDHDYDRDYDGKTTLSACQ